MNVAIFASAFHPHVGGVEELCRQLARVYRRNGTGVIVITNRWPRDLPEHETFENIPVYRIPMRVPDGSIKAHLNAHLTAPFIRRQMLDVLVENKIDLLHVQCVSSNAAYALVAKERLNLPLVVTAQGELTMDSTRLYQRSRYMRSLLLQTLDDADFITACSGHTLDELSNFYGKPFGERGTVVYNGIDPDDFIAATPHAHRLPYILGIGRLVAQKGFDTLIQAYHKADLPLHDLIIAGDGPERGPLEQLVKTLDLTKRVHFFGRADRAKATSLFRGASFFVLPSRHEPMGIVNLEAMAAGKAVIATRVGGVPEIVAENVNAFLVTPDDVPAMADAIRTLAVDFTLRAKFADASARRSQQYTWSAIAGQYEMIYRQVLSQAQTQSPVLAGSAQ